MNATIGSNEVFIVGGGSSLANFNFNLLADKETIVVNKAILDVPNPKNFITVDYTFIRKVGRNWLASQPVSKFFVVDMTYPFMKKIDNKYVDTRVNLVYENLDIFDIVVEAHKQKGIGYRFNDFRTGINSGYCALQLAVMLGYKKIYLMGFDLCTGLTTHYHYGYGESREKFNRKLSIYLKYFVFGLKQLQAKTNIQVFSCSKISNLNDTIPYVSVSHLL